MPEPTPEAWALIRHAYEHTSRPIVDICAEHGITDPMLRYRVKRWGWQKRRSLIPREGPPATPPRVAAIQTITAHEPLPACGERSAAGAERRWPGEGARPHTESIENPPHPMSSHRSDIDLSPQAGRGEKEAAEGEEIVPRLQSAVARVLPAIEATIARLASGSHRPRDMEQAGRTLSSLTRTLRELNALLAEHNANTGTRNRCCDCADMPEDMDAFRNELARRIRAFVASRTAQGDFDSANAPAGDAKPGEPR